MSLKGNVKKFCDDSTLHGFKELYYTSNCFWKLFWSLIIVGASAITVYQVYDTVVTYCTTPTIVNVYPLRGEIARPNVDFCFDVHYLLPWVSFDNKVLNNKTESYYFYLLSKITKFGGLNLFFSNSTQRNVTYGDFYNTFNKDTNQEMMSMDADYKKMLNDNFPNEVYFAKQLMAKTMNVQLGFDFGPTRIQFVEDYICYSYATNRVLTFSLKFSMRDAWYNPNAANRSSLASNLLDYYKFSESPQNNRYSNPKFTDTLDFARLSVVKVGVGSFSMSLKTNATYIISLSISDFISFNRPTKPCTSEQVIPSTILKDLTSTKQGIVYNTSCYNLCVYAKNQSIASQCFALVQTIGLEKDKDLNVSICGAYDKYVYNKNPDLNIECALNCPQPCNQWLYTVSTQIDYTSDNVTKVNINLPLPLSVMVSEEIPAYTWVTMISNIGGLLGIWLGASLLSFLQALYLLFIPQREPTEQNSSDAVTKMKASKNAIQDIN